MFGHERSLVQRFAGRPFVLLGVNGDESPQQLREVQAKANLTWASWWDGPNGAIGSAWKVDRYPTFVLIDRAGTIRWRQVGVPADGVLAAKIEELLQEAEKPPACPSRARSEAE
jgi:hypothetical protein